MNRLTLVTGADGFIGSHLTESLVRRGHSVRAMVCYNSFNSSGWLDSVDEEIRDATDVVSGDIRDESFVRDAVDGCDIIYHLAALIAIPYSYRAPASYIETNIKGTLNVLQAARAADVQRIVHTSTSEVYGTAKTVPISEEHPLQGQSPYAASKIGADQMAMAFHASFGTPVSIVRPFNTYGPRQSARAVIPTVISQIASGYRKLALGDLRPTRDFNYVSDTVKGFLAIANSEKTVGEVVNIGSGHEVSIGRLVGLISEVMKADVEIEENSERLRPAGSEVFRLCAGAEKAKRLTGWQPELAGETGLRKGLALTAEWFTDPSNLSFYKAGEYNV